MSSSRFEGLEGRTHPQEGEQYEPGVAGCDPRLADEAVECYLRGRIGDHHNRLSSGVRMLMEMLPTAEDTAFRPNSFLDEVIARLGERSPAASLAAIGCFLDPLVQALYENGHNSFLVDLAPLQDREGPLVTPRKLAENLEGTQDRPLEATYRCHAEDFADWVRFCALSLDGNAGLAGYGAYGSEFVLAGTVKMPGYFAEQSIFHLEMADQHLIHSADCTYYAKSIPEDIPFTHDAWKYFFSQGNTLVYLDCGEWREMRG